MKLCKDCKHFRPSFYEPYFGALIDAKCGSRKAGGTDVVLGGVANPDPYAARSAAGNCGPDGDFWEPKK